MKTASTRALTRFAVLSAILIAGPAQAQSVRIVALGDSNTAG